MKARTWTVGDAGRKGVGDKVGRRLWPLKSEVLCAEARRRTGLMDFGDPPLEPALSVLVNSLEQQVDLHPLGRFLLRSHLRDLLETRLRLAHAWKGHLDRLDALPTRRPIFITGMPRSGSTFLHELLAQDPDNRSPKVWEVMFPLPPGSGAQRARKAAARLWWFRRLAPEADAVHPIRSNSPHECVAIQSYTFLSEEFVATCRVPDYQTLLRSSDLRPVYAWEKRFLQHLQWGSSEKRWLLKSPDHAYGLQALFSVFPDAQIVQTHRNPLEVLKSLIQLTEVLQRLFARPENCDEHGEREATALSAAMERFIAFRDARPELSSRFVDVNYFELVADPLAVVRRIYRQFDMPLSETAVERMRQLTLQRSRYSGGRTALALADMGLDVSAQASRFTGYCRRFGIPLPQA